MADLPLLRIDIPAHKAWAGDQPLDLTVTEFRILAHLAQHAGSVRSHADIYEDIWGAPWVGTNRNSITMHVSRLRRALGDDRYIETVPGAGYRIDVGTFAELPPTLPVDSEERDLVEVLHATISDLQGYIDRRAAAIAEPLIAAARLRAEEHVAAAEVRHAAERQRWADLEAELRRQIAALTRRTRTVRQDARA